MPGPAVGPDIFDQTDDEGSISDEEIPGHNGGAVGEQVCTLPGTQIQFFQ